MIEEASIKEKFLSHVPMHKLLKVFGQDTVKAMFRELEADGSEWAKTTEATLRKKDPLALHLTFSLIK